MTTARRETWRWLLIAYAILSAAVGAVGIFAPSAAMEAAVGLWTIAYGVGMVGAGLLAAFYGILGRWRAVQTAILSLAALAALHGGLIVAATGTGGTMSGLRVAVAAVGLIGWVLTLRRLIELQEATARLEMRNLLLRADADERGGHE
ncbi:hypothetical protein [Janibacter massiliensis]|uniref:hypothetical protein n=1 Tax=Janibacter massiliensis TaxID=2058291 RepID=UPI00131A531E|nr:hypothetical protein [Janibacter massiliensis]